MMENKMVTAVTIRMSGQELAKLKMLAQKTLRSRSQVLRILLLDAQLEDLQKWLARNE